MLQLIPFVDRTRSDPCKAHEPARYLSSRAALYSLPRYIADINARLPPSSRASISRVDRKTSLKFERALPIAGTGLDGNTPEQVERSESRNRARRPTPYWLPVSVGSARLTRSGLPGHPSVRPSDPFLSAFPRSPRSFIRPFAPAIAARNVIDLHPSSFFRMIADTRERPLPLSNGGDILPQFQARLESLAPRRDATRRAANARFHSTIPRHFGEFDALRPDATTPNGVGDCSARQSSVKFSRDRSRLIPDKIFYLTLKLAGIQKLCNFSVGRSEGGKKYRNVIVNAKR